MVDDDGDNGDTGDYNKPISNISNMQFGGRGRTSGRISGRSNASQISGRGSYHGGNNVNAQLMKRPSVQRQASSESQLSQLSGSGMQHQQRSSMTMMTAQNGQLMYASGGGNGEMSEESRQEDRKIRMFFFLPYVLSSWIYTLFNFALMGTCV